MRGATYHFYEKYLLFLCFASLLSISCTKELASKKNLNLNTASALAFIESLNAQNNSLVTTKSGYISSQDEFEIMESTKPLLVSSKDFLIECGYDTFHDEFSDDDYNIIIFAEALADYIMRVDAVTGGGFAEGAETVASCFMKAIGVGGVPFAIDGYFKRGMSKAALKYAAKQLASKAIPYVGAALFAAQMALCLYNNWN